MANGTKITAGWSDAYEVDFTAGGGGGDRPIVLSYASSPPFTIPKGGTEPTTSALLDTCFRQVEYAGVLARREEPRGRPGVHRLHAEQQSFQEALPDNMYVFPVDGRVDAARRLGEFAKVAAEAVTVAPGTRSRRTGTPGCGSGATSPPDEPAMSRRAGSGRRRRWRPLPLAFLAVFFVAAGRGHARRGFCAGRAPRRRRGPRGARRGPGCTGCCGSPSGRRPLPTARHGAARRAGRVRALPAALRRPRAAARVRADAVRDADRRGRRRVPHPARVVRPARLAAASTASPAAIVAAHGVLQPRGRGAHRRRALGGPRPRAARRPPRPWAPRRGRCCRTVTLPALRPAIVSAASVVFLFCATAFGVVLTLGGLRYATVETEIYLLTTQFLDLRAAAALSVLQLRR